MRDSHAPFGEKERSQGSAIVLFEITVVVSYRPSIVTTAFGRNLPSNVADIQITGGWVNLRKNLGRKW